MIQRLLGLSSPFSAHNPVIPCLLGLPSLFSARNPVIQLLLGLPNSFSASKPRDSAFTRASSPLFNS
ncbi:hypothetical protein [Alkalihalobacillus pseudalcaliphilus]|uniref:hypothetical protein n=1 Tax=Alkalihalobacillus pseudalcaliphilus TaxID=79884 RepID=UPI00235DCC2B|nr:hypothetical protein [Alkalihalobacillus pseudalcaliphilus]